MALHPILSRVTAALTLALLLGGGEGLAQDPASSPGLPPGMPLCFSTATALSKSAVLSRACCVVGYGDNSAVGHIGVGKEVSLELSGCNLKSLSYTV